jgi:hypothetical protein
MGEDMEISMPTKDKTVYLEVCSQYSPTQNENKEERY